MTLSTWYHAVNDLYLQDKEKFLKLVELKADILTDIVGKDEGFKNLLILGFNPMLWKICPEDPNFEYNMLCYDKEQIEFCKNHEDLKHINTYHVDELEPKEQFDCVAALDSYFTRFSTEAEQRNAIKLAHSFTKNTLVTTVKDFKNIKSIDRLIDPPMVINSKKGSHVFVCHREWNTKDKQQFNETLYQLCCGELKSVVTEQKRTLYFKQLAKYIHDLGCKDFKISQTQFYKNLFSRSYEYIAIARK